MSVNTKLKPVEWGNTEQVFELFGLRKGMLYKLADTGQIRSTLIKTLKGNRKGTRLFDMNSIRDLLASNAS